MERLIVFVAWGAAYVESVALCIQEGQLPDYPIGLITDRVTPTDSLPQAVEVRRRDFAFAGKARKLEAIAAFPGDFGTVLFLDTDTRVIADLSLGFDKAETHGLAMAMAPHYSLADFRGFGRIMEREGVLPRGQLVYNSGVMFLDWRSAAVRAVFERALALALKDEATPWGDQTYISLAMEMMAFNPYTLSPSFNHRGFGELVSGCARVWHSNSPVPPNLASLESGYLHRYQDGTMVRALKVPL